MRVEPRIPSTKDFFFQTSIVLFPPSFKYHVIFQHQSEDDIGVDDIIDMIVVTVR